MHVYAPHISSKSPPFYLRPVFVCYFPPRTLREFFVHLIEFNKNKVTTVQGKRVGKQAEGGKYL